MPNCLTTDNQGVEVIVYSAGGVMSSGLPQMFEVARTARIPVIYPSLTALEGGLVVLGTNNEVTFHGAAALVDQILRGNDPAELQFVELETGWLAVNLRAAADIGYTFPPAVVDRADEIVE